MTNNTRCSRCFLRNACICAQVSKTMIVPIDPLYDALLSYLLSDSPDMKSKHISKVIADMLENLSDLARARATVAARAHEAKEYESAE